MKPRSRSWDFNSGFFVQILNVKHLGTPWSAHPLFLRFLLFRSSSSFSFIFFFGGGRGEERPVNVASEVVQLPFGLEGRVFGTLRDWHQRPFGLLGQTVSPKLQEHHMHVLNSRKNWNPSVCTSTTCMFCAGIPGHHIAGSAFRNQSIHGRVDSLLAISRISCSRQPSLQTSVHLPPSSTDHQAMRARPTFSVEEFCSWSVGTAPTQVWGTVWSSQKSMFTNRSLEAARDPAEACMAQSAAKQALARRISCIAISTVWHRQMTSLSHRQQTSILGRQASRRTPPSSLR